MIGAHGTDQAFLTYLKYAKNFQPDYVFLFFFDAHIWRTWSNTYCSNFGSNENLSLKIRPFSEISAKGAEQIRIILQLEKFHRFISDLSFMKEAGKRFPMIPSEYLNYISTHENLIDEEMIQRLSKAIESTSDLRMEVPRTTISSGASDFRMERHCESEAFFTL